MDVQQTLAVSAGVRASGVDLGDVPRFRLALERHGGRLLQRVFGQGGPVIDPRLPEHVGLTTAFSMKESVIKTAGGMPPGGRYTDIEINDDGGAYSLPVRLRGALGAWAESQRVSVVAGKEVLTDDLVLTWAVALGEGADL